MKILVVNAGSSSLKYQLIDMDGEVMLALVEAIRERRAAVLTMGRRKAVVAPLKLYVSAQTGRQYVLAWTAWNDGFAYFRIDAIDGAKPGEVARLLEDIDARLAAFARHAWGVSRGNGSRLIGLEMTVYAGPDEGFIPNRLEREKRCGRVEQLDDTHWRYTAQVYDALEMLPWIRTFTGRIVELKCDDAEVTERFYRDVADMARLYGGDGNAVP